MPFSQQPIQQPIPQRLLVIEDDPHTRLQLSETFVRVGFDVVAVPKGSEAIALCRTETFDAILQDMKLPGDDPALQGLGLIAQLLEICPGVPLVIMSAHPDELKAVKKAYPALLTLEKPFLIPTVTAVIQNLAGDPPMEETQAQSNQPTPTPPGAKDVTITRRPVIESIIGTLLVCAAFILPFVTIQSDDGGRTQWIAMPWWGSAILGFVGLALLLGTDKAFSLWDRFSGVMMGGAVGQAPQAPVQLPPAAPAPPPVVAPEPEPSPLLAGRRQPQHRGTNPRPPSAGGGGGQIGSVEIELIIVLVLSGIVLTQVV